MGAKCIFRVKTLEGRTLRPSVAQASASRECRAGFRRPFLKSCQSIECMAVIFLEQSLKIECEKGRNIAQWSNQKNSLQPVNPNMTGVRTARVTNELGNSCALIPQNIIARFSINRSRNQCAA